MLTALGRIVRRFTRDDHGATTAEYGIIIVVVAGIAIFVMTTLNGSLRNLYSSFGSKLETIN
jgi:Flp pilus assembly pilin Flp